MHRAALVVEHSASWPGARVLWRCVEFTQEAISGLSLLELAAMNSGQPPQVFDWGGGALTVCQINGEPREVPDRCFGPVSGPNWSDWLWSPRGWGQRPTGVTGYTVRDGDLEGWTYTTGFGSPPPATIFTQVCSSQVPASQHGAVPARIGPAKPSVPPAASAPAAAVALLPSTSPSTLPETAASSTAQGPAPAHAVIRSGVLTPAYALFGGSLLFLGGLLAWNLLRRAP